MNSDAICNSREDVENINQESSDSLVINISFNKSRSKNFKDAVSLITHLPNYNYDKKDDKYSCELSEIKEYVKHFLLVDKLINTISGWKSSVITLNDKDYSEKKNIYKLKEYLRSESGSYEVVLNSSTEYGMDSTIFEDLPLPLVYYPSHYGAFFGFSKDVGDEVFFCECERRAIENYIKLRDLSPLTNYVGLKTAPLGNDYFPTAISKMSKDDEDNPLSKFSFKEGICFRCNDKVPTLKYCHPMYGTLFKQKYGWYVEQKYFELGIDAFRFGSDNVLKEECPEELYEKIIGTNKRISEKDYELINGEFSKEIELLKKEISDTVENLARVELGFPKIGESWTSEVVMFNIVEGIYPDYDTKRHHRPEWLEGLEIDIFVPEVNIGFEYQGIQHFKPVEHWGGAKQLEKQQRHDKKKKKLCEEHGVRLITIDYNEELSTEHIKRKILNLQN